MFNPRQPLWLPAGSVRAIIALGLVAALIVTLPAEVGDLAKMVVAFYFGTKVAAAK